MKQRIESMTNANQEELIVMTTGHDNIPEESPPSLPSVRYFKALRLPNGDFRRDRNGNFLPGKEIKNHRPDNPELHPCARKVFNR